MVDERVRAVYMKYARLPETQAKEKEERDRLREVRKGWPISQKIGQLECLTLWGAALEVSDAVEAEACDDAYDERLPQLQEAISNGTLRALNNKSFITARTAKNHNDLIMREDFNVWLKDMYPFLDDRKEPNKSVSHLERPTVKRLIKAMQRKSQVDDKGSLDGLDGIALLKCFGQLIEDHYESRPTIVDFKKDMQRQGFSTLDEKTISKYFNRLDG